LEKGFLVKNKYIEFVSSLDENDLKELQNAIKLRRRNSFFKNYFSFETSKVILFIFVLEFSIEAIVEILFD
jgi:hypothetical protein